jgi:hypothetical protein
MEARPTGLPEDEDVQDHTFGRNAALPTDAEERAGEGRSPGRPRRGAPTGAARGGEGMSNPEVTGVPGEDPDAWEAREDDGTNDSEVDFVDDAPEEDVAPIDALAAEEAGAQLDDPRDYAEDDVDVIE